MNLMFLLPSLLIIGVFADEERIDDGGVEAITEKLWHEIKKRLGELNLDGEDISQQTDLIKDLSDKCVFDKNENVILMTHDSINNGAEFIASPYDVSQSECFNSCCGHENCNVAVFKEKKETACYLFNCGTNVQLCNFTAHPGFSVTKLPKKKVKVKSIHEDDLAKLVKTTTTTVSTTTTSTTTTTPKPTTTTTTTTTLPPPTTKAVNKKSPVKLFGKCDDDKGCAGASTECLAGYCVCQDGYHNQDDECRKDCSRFEFECANEGQPLAYPQCIAIYDTCDGVVHCSDQSDERSCPKNQPEISKPDKETSENELVRPQKPHKQKTTTSPTENPSSSTVSHQESKNKIPDVQTPESTTLPVDEKQQVDTTTPAVVEKSNPVISEPKAETSKPVSHVDQNTEKVNASLIIEHVDGAVMEAHVEEEEEEADASSIIQSNQGAVIALALGLTVTALLLVFVGCRLRNMKRRLRRGRPLDSNEADYLINGMYL